MQSNLVSNYLPLQMCNTVIAVVLPACALSYKEQQGKHQFAKTCFKIKG